MRVHHSLLSLLLTSASSSSSLPLPSTTLAASSSSDLSSEAPESSESSSSLPPMFGSSIPSVETFYPGPSSSLEPPQQHIQTKANNKTTTPPINPKNSLGFPFANFSTPPSLATFFTDAYTASPQSAFGDGLDSAPLKPPFTNSWKLAKSLPLLYLYVLPSGWINFRVGYPRTSNFWQRGLFVVLNRGLGDDSKGSLPVDHTDVCCIFDCFT